MKKSEKQNTQAQVKLYALINRALALLCIGQVCNPDPLSKMFEPPCPLSRYRICFSSMCCSEGDI